MPLERETFGGMPPPSYIGPSQGPSAGARSPASRSGVSRDRAAKAKRPRTGGIPAPTMLQGRPISDLVASLPNRQGLVPLAARHRVPTHESHDLIHPDPDHPATGFQLGGAVHSGMRQVWGASGSWTRQMQISPDDRRRDDVARFNSAWGVPPDTPMFKWDAQRRVYQPWRNWSGSSGLTHAERVGYEAAGRTHQLRAAAGLYLQPYKSGSSASPHDPWQLRWVRIGSTPYETVAEGYESLGHKGNETVIAAMQEASLRQQYERARRDQAWTQRRMADGSARSGRDGRGHANAGERGHWVRVRTSRGGTIPQWIPLGEAPPAGTLAEDVRRMRESPEGDYR